MKTKVVFLLNSLLICFCVYSQTPTNGLVAYYPFNENANDESGNANHGTIYNNALLTTDRFGSPNCAYQFDGINQYIQFPDQDYLSINTTGKLSVSVWMRCDTLDFPDTQGDGYVNWMGKSTASNHEWFFRIYNSNNTTYSSRTSCLAFNMAGSTSAYSYVQETITQREWNHYVFIYDKTCNLIRLYKNGILENTNSTTFSNLTIGNGNAPLRIGTQAFSSYFKGAIDDIRIYNRVLNVSEINALFKEPPTNGLVAYYPFNANANDESGNANHGTIYNNALLTTDRFDAPNCAYQFDGVNQYIQFPDQDYLSINRTGKLSVSVWMRCDTLDFPDTQGDGYVNWMGKSTASNHEWFFRIYNGNHSTYFSRITCHAFNMAGTTSASAHVQETITQREWNHYVFVYDKTLNLICLYKNGVLENTNSTTFSNLTIGNGSAPLRIGTQAFSSYFKGAIDDIRIYNRVLNVSEISALYNEPSTRGMVAYYPFNGNANDESINNNHGIKYNDPILTADRFGIENGAYKFNGLNQFIEASDQDYLSISETGKLSVSVWMSCDTLDFPSTTTEYPYVHWMGKGITNNHEWTFRIYNKNSYRPNRTSAYAFNLSGGLGSGASVQEALSVGQWIHYVAVYDFSNDTILFYKNGVYRKGTTFYYEGDIIPGNGTAPLRIGHRDGSNFFKGNIDDIRIYNKRLSPEEISDIYHENNWDVDQQLKVKKNTIQIQSLSKHDFLKVYPNPTTDYVIIDYNMYFEEYNDCSLRIINSQGKTVYYSNINTPELKLDIKSISLSGLHFIILTNRSGEVLEVEKMLLK